MIGFAPVPYAPNVIGEPDAPDDGGHSDSRHVHPLLNSTVSPGARLDPLTRPIVFHAVDTLVPAPPSPAAAQST